MSTSLLAQAFGVRDCHYVKTEFKGGKVELHLALRPDRLRCPACESNQFIRKGSKMRTYKTIPIGPRSVNLVFCMQRIECRGCGAVRFVQPDFAEAHARHTKAFGRYVLELLRMMNIKDVAEHLEVSWTFVKDIQKQYLQKHYGHPKLGKVRYLAIDEICIGRGYRYLTIVLDPETGEILFVGNGKGADALKPFWRRLRRSGAKIEAVAIDMSSAYISAVGANLPAAAMVFDHFHVVKLMNEKRDEFAAAAIQRGGRPAGEEGAEGNAPAVAEKPGESQPGKERARAPCRGVEAQRVAGAGVLPEGGFASALEPAGQGDGEADSL